MKTVLFGLFLLTTLLGAQETKFPVTEEAFAEVDSVSTAEVNLQTFMLQLGTNATMVDSDFAGSEMGISMMKILMAGGDVNLGNGGGGWVCRNDDQSVRWVAFVDLFEAVSQFNLTIPESELSSEDQLQLALMRIFSINRNFYSRLAQFLEIVETNWPDFGSDELAVVNDALYAKIPDRTKCQGGVLAYEQIVNFYNDSTNEILVNYNLFDRLSDTEKAALKLHEAIYLMQRKLNNAQDSREARKMVGYIFSNVGKDMLKKVLNGTVNPINSSNFSFVTIPAGTFMMGSPSNESGRDNDETLHRVTFNNSFEMQTTELTQKTWVEMMGYNPSKFQERSDCPNDYEVSSNGTSMCPNNPVEKVSWYDAQDFIKKLNDKNDRYLYRLPTEAEWEYAARAGNQSAYSFGNDDRALDLYGWYDGNSQNQTHQVASKQSNSYNLYDMHGNVWEWVSDWYGTYSSYNQVDPTGAQSGPDRVLRGGSWSFDGHTRSLRSASRTAAGPSCRNVGTGFRLVRTAR